MGTACSGSRRDPSVGRSVGCGETLTRFEGGSAWLVAQGVGRPQLVPREPPVRRREARPTLGNKRGDLGGGAGGPSAGSPGPRPWGSVGALQGWLRGLARPPPSRPPPRRAWRRERGGRSPPTWTGPFAGGSSSGLGPVGPRPRAPESGASEPLRRSAGRAGRRRAPSLGNGPGRGGGARGSAPWRRGGGGGSGQAGKGARGRRSGLPCNGLAGRAAPEAPPAAAPPRPPRALQQRARPRAAQSPAAWAGPSGLPGASSPCSDPRAPAAPGEQRGQSSIRGRPRSEQTPPPPGLRDTPAPRLHPPTL